MQNAVMIMVFSLVSVFSFGKMDQRIDSITEESLFDQLNDQEIQEILLETDLESLISDRRSDQSFKAVFRFTDREGIEQSWDAKVNIRGKFRRIRCSEMPPLKLNFKKGDLAKAGLTLHDDYKLVTQCIEEDDKAKEVLLKEYLAYKIYNELTDYSFRVQLLKINFLDTKTGITKKQWGFIIEDTAELRARLDGKKYKGKFGVARDSVDQEQAKIMALFQYMIGNLDWDLYKRLHNAKLIYKADKLIPVPYDFDFSGLVSAPYALLNSNYEVESIKDRLYLGPRKDLENMTTTIGLFEAKKSTILQLIKAFKPLSHETRREVRTYIRSFYKDIDTIKLPEIKPATDLSIK